MVVQGANYAGTSQGFVLAGSGANIDSSGAQLAASHPREQVDVPPRGTGYSNNVGAQYASPADSRWGGTYGTTSRSVDTLLDSDGFALVLDRGDGTRRAFTVDTPSQSIESLSVTEETNVMSDWQVDVPPDPDLYDWSFSRAVIGYQGDRLFHGVMLPVESSYGSNMTLGGYGPLWYATHGHLEVTYPDDHPDYDTDQDIPAWAAINHAWREASDMTNGEVRGYAVPPEDWNERIIPSSGQSWSGTPLEVIQELHSYAGMAFSIDHSDPSSLAISFMPGETMRAGNWQQTDYSVDIDPSDYANKVVVRGADVPSDTEDSYPYDRWRGEATATTHEIDAVTNGRIIEHNMDAPDLSSETACEEQARSKLEELRGNYSITGSVTTVPTHLTPGYTYRVKEFDTAAPEPFVPVEAPLQSIEHNYGWGGGEMTAETSLKFETEDGLVRAIRRQYLPEGASLAVHRQNSQFD